MRQAINPSRVSRQLGLRSSHRARAPFSAPWKPNPLRASDGPQGGPPEESDKLKEKFFKSEQPSSTPKKEQLDSKAGVQNPVDLGRAARRAFDDVWSGISNLTSPTRSTYIIDDTLEASAFGFAAPQAAYTTVLVVGATGRVGKIVTRKLLLRGYKIKALVRKASASSAVPSAVDMILGDVGEMKDCQEAVRGVQKVIYCAGARSSFTADLIRVEDRGVMNIAKAMQDEMIRQAAKKRGGLDKNKKRYSASTKKEIADFEKKYHQERWDIVYVGNPDADPSQLGRRAQIEAANENVAIAEITDDNNLIFEGCLPQRGAIAEVGAKMTPLLPEGEHRTKATEGLVLRVRGDGHQYTCVLRTTEGFRFAARFPTRTGYLTVRLPYSAFRSETMAQLPAPGVGGSIALPPRPILIPENIDSVCIRYENRRTNLAAAARLAKGLSAQAEFADAERDQRFELEVDWIKAIPASVMAYLEMSSSETGHTDLQEEGILAKMVEFKRKGEDNLRLSGLGYSIIRPGQLVQEPGGYKALVFDQGDRIEQSISAADVADIALRALHEPEARNKTFDVCYEYQADEDMALYELVANVAVKKSDSYLKTAVSTLAKNT
eukprot:gene7042-138_t